MSRSRSSETFLLWCECWPGSHMDVDVRWPSADQCGATIRRRFSFPGIIFGGHEPAPNEKHDDHQCTLPHNQGVGNIIPHEGEHVCSCGTRWGWDDNGRLLVDGIITDIPHDTGHACTWLEWLLEAIGWDEIIRVGEDGDDAAFCLKYGIAPGQPFLVLFHDYVSIHTNTPDSGEDFDEEWQTTVVMVEQWSPDRVLRAWEEWLAEGCAEHSGDSDSFDSVHR